MKHIKSHLLIRNLELLVHLGWPKQERLEAQIVFLEIKISFLKPPQACQTDELTDTICYASLIEKIKTEVKQSTYHLIEHLAASIFKIIQETINESISLSVRIIKHPKIAGLNGDVSFTYEEVNA